MKTFTRIWGQGQKDGLLKERIMTLDILLKIVPGPQEKLKLITEGQSLAVLVSKGGLLLVV